ncbi:cobalamin B12-binding domain-containing protein [Streptomyces sp. WMMB 322]|uniref:cobalamin B12-binding domain-containing protein n=1 Tax=Streptomyces sp. WMMB 322 TaxID=1286821 RepID=UPI0006E1EA25|nr:cobalamin B12-binding domain-containing protein [Streptomyces sp. WMMB 322]SCK37712.1 B12 binding domain-containing protein [Streptomyces sp. WMMB 322]
MSDSRTPQPLDIPAVGLTTGAVARRFGIAPTTLRSWDHRYGIGPAAHEGGRHRRWTRHDLSVLERMCQLTSTGIPPSEAARTALNESSGVASARPADQAGGRADEPPTPPAGPPGKDGRQLRGLRRAAWRLDSRAIEGLLTAAVEERGLVAAWDEVMMPALNAVGRKWERSGERYIEVEHLLSWHVSTVLRRAAAPRGGGASASSVLLACVPGEEHTLPLEALNAALTEHGVAISMLGAAVPTEALDAAVRRTGPAAVVLWAQSFGTASRPLARHLSSLKWGVRGARMHPAVMVAGPGWARPHPAGTLRPRRLGDAVRTLLALTAR